MEDAVKAFDNIKVGMPWEEDTQMGAQIYEAHLNDILKYIDLAKKKGQRSLVAANALPKGNLPKAASCVPL